MKEFKIKAKFVFKGDLFIKAKSRSEAIEIAEKQVGMTLNGGIHSPLPHDVLGWEFPVHPLKAVR